MPNLNISESSGIPIYRQIVEQIRYMIESGALTEGEQLPSARLLADNLGINRNTIAKAYSLLRDTGLITTRGRFGTTVRAEQLANPIQAYNTDARDLLLGPIHECLTLGVSAEEVASLARHIAFEASSEQIKITFTECNDERARAFAKDLSERLGLEVVPSLIAELDSTATDSDLLITTFFHLAEVRRWARDVGQDIETAAIVVAPHVQTLVKIAAIPKTAKVAVRYSTDEQAEHIRDSLRDACPNEITVIPRSVKKLPPDIDVLIIPSEMPELGEGTPPKTQVIEFGNVLDEGSVRMIEEIVDDIRGRHLRVGLRAVRN